MTPRWSPPRARPSGTPSVLPRERQVRDAASRRRGEGCGVAVSVVSWFPADGGGGLVLRLCPLKILAYLRGVLMPSPRPARPHTAAFGGEEVWGVGAVLPLLLGSSPGGVMLVPHWAGPIYVHSLRVWNTKMAWNCHQEVPGGDDGVTSGGDAEDGLRRQVHRGRSRIGAEVGRCGSDVRTLPNCHWRLAEIVLPPRRRGRSSQGIRFGTCRRGMGVLPGEPSLARIRVRFSIAYRLHPAHHNQHTL